MMSEFDPERLPPLPVTLERAHEEIRYLQKRLFLANQQVAAGVIKREQDKRAAQETIKLLVEELQDASARYHQKLYPTESCIKERANGAGGCGACSLCCKEAKEKAEELAFKLLKLDKQKKRKKK